ncbi:dsRNA-binding motif domain-containing protein [Streptomyces rubiginosohelvolus]|uniref:hypothetical protein n=1 Tax=Streptomyces rubiginosohelvolus TaxID=67362 RepID=UPI003717814C
MSSLQGAGATPPHTGAPAAQPVPRVPAPGRTRTFTCPNCGAREIGRGAPAHWYLLAQGNADGTATDLIGAYCTRYCLTRSWEGTASGRLPGARAPEEEDLRERREQLEQLLGLLHQGQTVRQAGDRVGLSTRTVQTWLRTARIPIVDGRLAGVDPALPPRQPPSPPAQGLRAVHPASTALGALNELKQSYWLLDLTWSDPVASGPPHDPQFTYTVSATRADSGTTVTATATASQKTAARQHAARNLLDQLTESTSQDPPGPQGEAGHTPT